MKKSVCVLGCGYIGLPAAIVMAENGFMVTGVDSNPEVIDTLARGKLHIQEPGLQALFENVLKTGRLQFNVSPPRSDVFVICVPTPVKQSESLRWLQEPDLSYVERAANDIGHLVKKDGLVILESTSPIGTTQRILEIISRINDSVSESNFAYCPERILPGDLVNEFLNNSRVVGGLNDESTKSATDFYASFVTGQIFPTNSKVAELCKLAENSYRDVNIAFANELSLLCDDDNIDVWDLIKLANMHPRVNILKPGPGVGGHCIAVDPWFLISQNPGKAKLIAQARQVNQGKTQWVVGKIQAEATLVEMSGGKPVICCMGLAYKPDADDIRESPALEIYNAILKLGFKVIAVEPNISSIDGVDLHNFESAQDVANIFVLLVPHTQFKFDRLKRIHGLKVLDFCGGLRN